MTVTPALDHPDKILCSICNDPIHGSDWVICSRCDVPIHRACWTYAGACPVYACGSREFKENVDLLLRSKAPVVIDGVVPSVVPQEREVVVRSPEERAVTYLKVDTRREELVTRLADLVYRKKTARWYIPGGSWLPPFVLLMFLDPLSWHVWLGFFAFGVTLGVLKKIRLTIGAPPDEEIDRVRSQIQVLERFSRQLEPLPPGRGGV